MNFWNLESAWDNRFNDHDCELCELARRAFNWDEFLHLAKKHEEEKHDEF